MVARSYVFDFGKFLEYRYHCVHYRAPVQDAGQERNGET